MEDDRWEVKLATTRGAEWLGNIRKSIRGIQTDHSNPTKGHAGDEAEYIQWRYRRNSTHVKLKFRCMRKFFCAKCWGNIRGNGATSGKRHFLQEVEWNRVELSGTKDSREPSPPELYCWSVLIEYLPVAVVIHPSESLPAPLNLCRISDGVRQHLFYSAFYSSVRYTIRNIGHKAAFSHMSFFLLLCFLLRIFSFLYIFFFRCVLLPKMEWIRNRISEQDKNHTKHENPA